MTTFQRILSQFQKLGFYEDSNIQQQQIKKALDALASQNAGFRQFDHDIAEQLWQHTDKQQSRTVRLRDFVNTVQQADNILRDQVAVIKGQMQGQSNPQRRNQLQQQLNDVLNDHRELTAPFRMSPLAQSEIYDQHQQRADSKMSSNRNDSVIFGYQSNQRKQSAVDLKILLMIAILWTIWELILLFHKNHFQNLLACFIVLSIFLLNYFDKQYIQFVMGFLAATCLLDIAWMVMHSTEYWNGIAPTQHSTLQTSFLSFIVVMTAILILVKIIIVGILFKYRKNSDQIRKNVSLFGYRIKLDGRPTYNLFTPLFGKNNDDF